MLRICLLVLPLLVCLRCCNGLAEELPPAVAALVQERCVDCHNAEERNGGIDLSALLADDNIAQQVEAWEKVEQAIKTQKMPPRDEPPLDDADRQTVATWFHDTFVLPGGIQRAGVVRPRRLTREELQNTLEDILHVKLRTDVTNSRLHRIPDTVIEKFFPHGVIGDNGFSNDDKLAQSQTLDIQTYARCFSLILSQLDSNAKAREPLFGTASLPLEIDDTEAREVIRQFGTTAFRRPLSSQELDETVGVFRKMVKNGDKFAAMKASFLSLLLSPSFLYRFEEPVESQAEVTQQELAVRLAYFLWSAPPDRELMELAQQKKLNDTGILKQQVTRMLADPRRIALAENLGGEWFDYKKLRQQTSTNKRSDQRSGFYRTQYEEALLLFDSMIRFDQPIFRLLDADWVFMNRHQARLYKLEIAAKQLEAPDPLPPISIHFRSNNRQVENGTYEYRHAPLELFSPNDPNRLGFLTLGATMSVTSTENRTSPIRRGVWVLERLLGKHFVVPDDVPDLEASRKKAKSQQLNLSDNEILKLHSSQQGCASCHQFIDPIGFGLEQFDQHGISRSVPLTEIEGEKLTWTPQLTHRSYADQTWQLKGTPTAGQLTRVFFQFSKGRNRLDVRNVRLRSGDFELRDEHVGFAGDKHHENVWKFNVPEDAPKSDWRLIAEIRGSGGNDSHGTITIADEEAKIAGFKLPNGKEFRSPAELKDLLLLDYREPIIDNTVKRVFSYAMGRKVLPSDRPAIAKIKQHIEQNDYRMNALIEAVALSFPFRHKEFE